jgi:hypothetical protein
VPSCAYLRFGNYLVFTALNHFSVNWFTRDHTKEDADFLTAAGGPMISFRDHKTNFDELLLRTHFLGCGRRRFHWCGICLLHSGSYPAFLMPDDIWYPFL